MAVNALLFGRDRSRLRAMRGVQLLLRRRFLRQRVFAAVLTDELALCRILGRLKLYVDPADFDISHHIMADGIWESRTTEVMVDRMAPGGTAIDVGANLGYFAMLLADLAGADGRVIACEPNPAMVRRIGFSAAINGFNDRIAIVDRPISDRDDVAVGLAVPARHPGGAQIVAPTDGATTHRTLRLDGIDGAADATLVKIDVEGHEAAVWAGMAAMIAGPALRTVVMEFAPASHPDPEAFLGELAAAGFAVELIDDRRGRIRAHRARLVRTPISQLLLTR